MGWCSGKIWAKVNNEISFTLHACGMLNRHLSSQYPVPTFLHSYGHGLSSHSFLWQCWKKISTRKEIVFFDATKSAWPLWKAIRTNIWLSGKVSSNARNIKSLVYFSAKQNMMFNKCMYKIINCFDDNYSYSCCNSGWLLISCALFLIWNVPVCQWSLNF